MDFGLGLILVVVGVIITFSGTSERVRVSSPGGAKYNGPAGIFLIILGALLHYGVI